MTATSDLELLTLRADSASPRLDLRGARLFSTTMAEVFSVGAAVPPPIAAALEAEHRRGGRWDAPHAPSAVLAECQRLLAEHGWNVDASSSLVYGFESSVSAPVDVPIERSDAPVAQWIRGANPGNWHPVEWDELLDGQLGPWTMAAENGRVASICHTPLPMTDRCAECGVWTDPAYRGRGYAAATTAEWAALLCGSGRRLFYSTLVDNVSSQRVAQRLKLRLIGYEASVTAVEEGVSDVHPLSRVRAGAPGHPS